MNNGDLNNCTEIVFFCASLTRAIIPTKKPRAKNLIFSVGSEVTKETINGSIAINTCKIFVNSTILWGYSSSSIKDTKRKVIA